MDDLLYQHSSPLIGLMLLLSMLIGQELGFRLGLRMHAETAPVTREQTSTILGAMLGLLALVLGFCFSLALQRFDDRSQAVVTEANAIGTTWLRAQLLEEPARSESLTLLRQYIDQRLEEGAVSLDQSAARRALQERGDALAQQLWGAATRAVAADPKPATSGLYVQSLNEMIDAQASYQAALARHVPELVLWLVFLTLVLTTTTMGYSAGLGGRRAPFASLALIGLIGLVVYLIIDLDRPRRGFIQVSQQPMLELQASSRATAIDSKPPP